MNDKSKALIKSDEGLRLTAYQDSLGIWTIGYGHNMQASKRFTPPYKGLQINAQEADSIFEDDFNGALTELEDPPFWQAYHDQNEARQAVLENMMFNLGGCKFEQFKKFLAAMTQNDYPEAAKEMQDSKWWTQVGSRAQRLQKMILSGAFI
jgi:lysozyme